MRPGTDKLLAKARRALAAAEAALESGASDVAAGRAFYAILYAAKARLNDSGLSLRSHARIAAAYAALPEIDEAPAAWLDEALALRRRLAEEDADGLDYAAVEALVTRAVRFVPGSAGGSPAAGKRGSTGTSSGDASSGIASPLRARRSRSQGVATDRRTR